MIILKLANIISFTIIIVPFKSNWVTIYGDIFMRKFMGCGSNTLIWSGV